MGDLSACEIIIMFKSTYSGLPDLFVAPKSTIWKTLNVILLPFKITSLKHLWDVIVVVDINTEIFREVIRLTTIKKIGRATYLLSDE